MPNVSRYPQEVLAHYAPAVNYLNPGGCWIMQTPTNSWGYCYISFNQRTYPAHRFFYEQLVGPIPEGFVVDHICRERRCINPMHLQAITKGENTALGKTRNTHCKQGHEYTEENTYTSTGHRVCKMCTSEQNRRSRAKRAARKASA